MSTITLWLFTVALVVGLAVAVVESKAGMLRRWYMAAVGLLMLGLIFVDPIDIYLHIWVALISFGYAIVPLSALFSRIFMIGAVLFALIGGIMASKNAVMVIGFVLLPCLLFVVEMKDRKARNSPSHV